MVVKVLRKWPRSLVLAAVVAGASAILNAPAAVANAVDKSPAPAGAFADAGLASTRRPGSVSDWNGDGLADVFAVNSDGNLFVYLNDGLQLDDSIQIGSGWGLFRLVRAADVSGDGFADVIAIDNSGNMLYYPHNGDHLDGPVPMPGAANGVWANVEHLMVADWSCDGHADILVVQDGNLWYYANNNNSISHGLLISTGWSGATHVEAADWSSDGCADILSQRASTETYTTLYSAHNGSGLSAAIAIAFGGPEKFLRPMDFNGDGRADLINAKRDGNLYYTPNNGADGLGTKVQIGSGFGDFLHIL